MGSDPKNTPAEVFVSYASHDAARVVPIVKEIESAGVSVWRDQEQIFGGANYGPEIVEAIEHSKLMMLMCSEASLRSRNVKSEIRLAWCYDRPYLPLLLDSSIGSNYPKQVQYWLEGCQWVEILDHPITTWLPRVMHSIEKIKAESVADYNANSSVPLDLGYQGLRNLASFTDQIWPEQAGDQKRGHIRGTLRDLGALPEESQHRFSLGDRVCLAIESDRQGHLLLLNEGTSGKIYCLCPSLFANSTRLNRGLTYLPQADSPLDSFVLTGKNGREQLLAIITDQPLELDWMKEYPSDPARVIEPPDIASLLDRLRELEVDQWTALSTYFDVTD